jgi:hypothetical protein
MEGRPVLEMPVNRKLVFNLVVSSLVCNQPGPTGDLPAQVTTDVDLPTAKPEPEQPNANQFSEELLVDLLVKPDSVLTVQTSTVLDQIPPVDATVFRTHLLLPTPLPALNLELVQAAHILIDNNGLFHVPIVLSALLTVLTNGLNGLPVIADTIPKTDPTLSHNYLEMVVEPVLLVQTELSVKAVFLLQLKIV